MYAEVEDRGQNCISVRWVVTPKMINGQPSVKARLCAKGFQEQQDFRTDSPTCSRESVRVVLAAISCKKWVLRSVDVRSAFLQGSPIDRIVFISPPPEANTSNIWMLKKCVYGLADAPRHFYLRLRDELAGLGITPCKLDMGLFFWYKDSTLCGILVCFVDDILWGGTNIFKRSVIDVLGETLQFGTESCSSFTYIGVTLRQLSDFTIEQIAFAKKIALISTSPTALDESPITDQQRTALRSAIGKLNWLANSSRPDISYSATVSAGLQQMPVTLPIQISNLSTN